MKIALIVVIALAFLGIFIAGPLSMGNEMHNGCLAATAQRTNCPESGLMSASFHIGALKWFSSALLNMEIATILAILLLTAGFIFRLLQPIFFPPQFFILKSFRPFQTRSERRVLRWLKLHENSPSFC